MLLSYRFLSSPSIQLTVFNPELNGSRNVDWLEMCLTTFIERDRGDERDRKGDGHELKSACRAWTHTDTFITSNEFINKLGGAHLLLSSH